MDTQTIYILVSLVSCLLSLVIGGAVVGVFFMLSNRRKHSEGRYSEYEYIVIPDVPYKVIEQNIGPLLRHGWEPDPTTRDNPIVQGYTTWVLRKRKARK